MNDTLISTRDLSKSYAGTEALVNLNFSLRRGQIVGLLGPNGAGKSTAIHIMLGLLSPSSGRVTVLGHDPVTDHFKIAPQMNFSSSYANLPPNLKIWESLNIFSLLYSIRDRKKKIAKLLEIFEIAHLSNRLVGALSSGEKTRLSLVRGLLNDPVLLVLDEPTASLDPEISEKVRRILKQIQVERNMGILYTSHNMHEVESLCDRVIFIHRGRTIAEGSPDEVRKIFSSSSLEQAFIKMVRGGNLISEEG